MRDDAGADGREAGDAEAVHEVAGAVEAAAVDRGIGEKVAGFDVVGLAAPFELMRHHGEGDGVELCAGRDARLGAFGVEDRTAGEGDCLRQQGNAVPVEGGDLIELERAGGFGLFADVFGEVGRLAGSAEFKGGDGFRGDVGSENALVRPVELKDEVLLPAAVPGLQLAVGGEGLTVAQA